jgi:hypothetical protein
LTISFNFDNIFASAGTASLKSVSRRSVVDVEGDYGGRIRFGATKVFIQIPEVDKELEVDRTEFKEAVEARGDDRLVGETVFLSFHLEGRVRIYPRADVSVFITVDAAKLLEELNK